jgi:hypothetical protein
VPKQHFLQAYFENLSRQANRSDVATLVKANTDLIKGFLKVFTVYLVDRCLLTFALEQRNGFGNLCLRSPGKLGNCSSQIDL